MAAARSGFPRSILGGCLLLSLLATRGALAESFTGKYIQETVPTIESPQQLSDAIDVLHRMSWSMYSAAPTEPDVRGRTMQQDIDEWAMRKDVSAQLDAALAESRKADAQHQAAATHKALERAAVLVQQERYRVTVIWLYWGFESLMATHAANLAALESRLPEDDAAGRRARITPSEQAFAAALTAAVNAATQNIDQQTEAARALESAAAPVFAAFNGERGKLAALVSTYEHAQGKPAVSRAREGACPDPVPPTGSDRARPGHLFPNAANFYPAVSRRLYYEGAITIAADISATGCIEKAEVRSSSGVAELDAGALDLALQGNYEPAGHDGKGVASTLLFRIQFKFAQ
jgi:TonB family protein